MLFRRNKTRPLLCSQPVNRGLDIQQQDCSPDVFQQEKQTRSRVEGSHPTPSLGLFKDVLHLSNFLLGHKKLPGLITLLLKVDHTDLHFLPQESEDHISFPTF